MNYCPLISGTNGAAAQSEIIDNLKTGFRNATVYKYPSAMIVIC